jgi:sugar (pentulose or hexulose) kinase
MMITNHACPGMWEMEGLSNAAASSYRWFRDVIGTHEKELEARDGRSAYEYLNDLAEQAPACSKGLLYLPYLGSREPSLECSFSARRSIVRYTFTQGEFSQSRPQVSLQNFQSYPKGEKDDRYTSTLGLNERLPGSRVARV